MSVETRDTSILNMVHRQPIASSRHFHKLRDGRKICHDCCNYMLLDSSEVRLSSPCEPVLWVNLLVTYATIGARRRERSVGLYEGHWHSSSRVYLVESCVLNAHKKKGTSTHGDNPLQNHVTRGLCLSEVSQIQHMVRSGTHAAPRVTSIDKVRVLLHCTSARTNCTHRALVTTDSLGERDSNSLRTTIRSHSFCLGARSYPCIH
ncbi:hypothetical protein PsorP6_011196 [Peronosclerospora sorghi]|uniref:Uncharacterized protein n=1 Tax=Peronosclerospora sorghi TaxID=230839 RepID=A0ACC0VV70_9STRA|nr:hypothetical protein PsorP6_011196 [Peronosclerospora sorghi]